MNNMKILSEINLPELEQAGFIVEKLNYGNRLYNYLFHKHRCKILRKFTSDHEIAVIVCGRATAAMVSGMDFPALQLIQLTSTGFDGVPVGRLQERDINVANLKNVYTNPIAETVLYALLRFSRRLRSNPQKVFPALVRGYEKRMTELAGKKALLLGTGNIGTAIAVRLAAFEVQVDGYSLNNQPQEPYRTIYSDKVELLQVMHKQQYDFVISSLPANNETLHFCDPDFFRAMGNKAIFCNIGRTATVDQQALFHALKNYSIGGAAIDSVEVLPFALFNRFRRLNNVVVFPGIAAASQESVLRVRTRIAENIQTFIATGSCQDIL